MFFSLQNIFVVGFLFVPVLTKMWKVNNRDGSTPGDQRVFSALLFLRFRGPSQAPRNRV